MRYYADHKDMGGKPAVKPVDDGNKPVSVTLPFEKPNTNIFTHDYINAKGTYRVVSANVHDVIKVERDLRTLDGGTTVETIRVTTKSGEEFELSLFKKS